VLSEKILKKNKNDSKCLGERFRMLVKYKEIGIVSEFLVVNR